MRNRVALVAQALVRFKRRVRELLAGVAVPTAASSTEPPDTDPYVRWCGRGEAVRPLPIPIAMTSDVKN